MLHNISRNVLLGRGASARFVAAATRTSQGTTTATLASLGARVGDFLFVQSDYTAVGSINGRSLTDAGGFGGVRGSYAILRAADLAYGVNCSWGFIVALYRGPVASAAFVVAVSGSSPVSFVKASNHRGIVACLSARATSSITTPADFVRRAEVTSSNPPSGGTSVSDLYDRLSPPSSAYHSGSSITGSSAAGGGLFELRGA